MNTTRTMAAVFLLLSLASCSRNPADRQQAPEEAPPAYMGISNPSGVIDFDAMPVSIRYANAYTLVLVPEEYAGRLLKVTAPVTEMAISNQKKKMLAFTIYDAAQCCLVTIPFELDKTASVDKGSIIGRTVTITGKITPLKKEIGFYLSDSQVQP